jgi:hypothetical protein
MRGVEMCINIRSNLKRNNIIFFIPIAVTILLIISGCGGGDSGGSGGGAAVSSTSPPPTHTGTVSATIQWDAPTTNEDGNPLTDLDRYEVRYGQESGNYPKSASIDKSYTSASVSDLSIGIWCFVVVAYDTAGNPSDPSGEVCGMIS